MRAAFAILVASVAIKRAITGLLEGGVYNFHGEAPTFQIPLSVSAAGGLSVAGYDAAAVIID